jgi:S1-C subfamily serine protease
MNTRGWSILILLAALLLPLAAAAAPLPAPEAPAPPVPEVYRRCCEAGLEVLIEGRHAGSGWFASSNGLAVTAAHLFLKPPRRVEIVSLAYGRLPVTVLGIDRGHDVAAMKASPRAGGYATLPLAAQVPQVGEDIHQFGAPLFRAAVFQSGKVARADPGFEFYSEPGDYVEILHVSAMMQSGTSGGPWLNRLGEVVGLQSGLMSVDGKPLGVAFMAPAPGIRSMLAQPRTATTPTLGLAVDHLWESSTEFIAKLPAGAQGLVVSRLRRGGPAEQAGLKKKDVIIAAEGRSLTRVPELLRLVRARRPGDTFVLSAIRPESGGTNNYSLPLGRVEEDWSVGQEEK